MVSIWLKPLGKPLWEDSNCKQNIWKNKLKTTFFKKALQKGKKDIIWCITY